MDGRHIRGRSSSTSNVLHACATVTESQALAWRRSYHMAAATQDHRHLHAGAGGCGRPQPHGLCVHAHSGSRGAAAGWEWGAATVGAAGGARGRRLSIHFIC